MERRCKKLKTCTQEHCIKNACAMNVALRSAVVLAYGLGNAPRSWWLSVDMFLTSMGGRRTLLDPTVWCFSTEGLEATYALGAAYVGDIIITGTPGQRFEQLKNALSERCRLGFVEGTEFWSVRCSSSPEGEPHDCS